MVERSRSGTPWTGLTVSGAQVVNLRLMAVLNGVSVQITYENGSVFSAHAPGVEGGYKRVLALPEIRDLLGVLREQLRVTPRPRDVDPTALAAFVGALARLVNSPGTIPFGTAVFGPVEERRGLGLIGTVQLDADVLLTVHDIAGELYYELPPRGRSAGSQRRLTRSQRRALIGALRSRRASSTPLDARWSTILAHAIKLDEANGAP